MILYLRFELKLFVIVLSVCEISSNPFEVDGSSEARDQRPVLAAVILRALESLMRLDRRLIMEPASEAMSLKGIYRNLLHSTQKPKVA